MRAARDIKPHEDLMFNIKQAVNCLQNKDTKETQEARDYYKSKTTMDYSCAAKQLPSF